MPRKVTHQDDDYGDAYGDYDYYEDYDYDEEDNGEVAESQQETNKAGLWSCPICTYDNDESMSVCDVCGVLRNPLVKSSSESCNGSGVGGICKDSGASIMAKSLFASLPQRTPKIAVVGQLQNDEFVMGKGNSFLKLGSSQGNFHEFHKAFSTHNRSKVKIAPFKFDVPSPDDLVSKGLRSSKTGSKDNSADSKSSRVSINPSERSTKADAQLSATRSASATAVVQKGKAAPLDGSNSSKIDSVHIKESGRSSDGSSTVKSKDRPVTEDDSSYDTYSRDARLGGLRTKGRFGDDSCASSNNKAEAHSRMKSLETDGSKYLTTVNARGTNSRSKYKPENWMLPDEIGDNLMQLNLAIVGHVDSGKSTLSGRLLHLLGRISKKEMHKYEKEAKLQGKASFAYAWALDESAEERERGITMTVAVAYFDSKNYHVVVLDSPGHKDFVPNMISGATQADAAILVIDASTGAFEVGMDSKKGQTREHAQLIRSFGVDQIIVAVNKMDIVQYSKNRFDSIKLQLGTFLRTCGFKDSYVTWIPLSAIENQNLVATPSDVRLLTWYQGPSLLNAIDSLQPPARDFSKPLLMPICDVVKLQQGQVSACGKLEAGALRSGLKVLVMPTGVVGTVHSVERDSQACSTARAGDNVAVRLQGIDANHVMAGGVLCHPDFPVAVATHLELKILVLELATPILIGSQLEFHIHHAKEAATIVKILSLLDIKTGKVIKKSPRCLMAKQSAVVEVALQEPVCVEEFLNSRALGRVFLRALGRTVAVGIVSRIIEECQ